MMAFKIAAGFSVIIAFAATAHAKTCADVFFAKAPTPISVTDLVKAPTLLTPERRAEIIGLETSEQKVLYALKQLKDAGVNAVQIHGDSNQPPIFALQISTEGSSYLNRIAASLYRNYEVDLIFNPETNMRVGAAADFKSKIIYISNTNAYQGLPDTLLFHEIRHIAMSAREAKGDPPLINGTMEMIEHRWLPKTRWAWGDGAKSGYESYMSFQELSTWYQDFRYAILGYKRLLAKPLILKIDLIEYLTDVTVAVERLDDVTDFIHRAIRFEIDAVVADKFTANYRTSDDFIEFKVSRSILFSDTSRATNRIPWQIFESHLPAAALEAKPADLAVYFETRAGKAVIKRMILDFLEQLKRESESVMEAGNYYRGITDLLDADVRALRLKYATNVDLLKTQSVFDSFARGFLQERIGRVRFSPPQNAPLQKSAKN